MSMTLTVPSVGAPGFRLAVHRVSDEIVRWAAGTEGSAASRLLFLAGVLVMVFIESPLTMLVTAIACALMVWGWFLCRKQIHEIAATRDGYTGSAPVVANRPFPGKDA